MARARVMKPFSAIWRAPRCAAGARPAGCGTGCTATAPAATRPAAAPRAGVRSFAVLVEEDLRRGLDADRGAPADRAERHGVEVVLEDPALGVLLLELGGQLGLADLALEVAARVLDVERAHQLLGDRRAALHVLAGLDVLHAGADDRRRSRRPGACRSARPRSPPPRCACSRGSSSPRDGSRISSELHVAQRASRRRRRSASSRPCRSA